MAFFAKASATSETVSGNILICPLCEEEYDDPKRLPCMHTICLGCLESVVPLNSLILKCPLDDQELPMPKGGVNALPSDMKIVRLLELTSGGQTKKKPRTVKKLPKISDEAKQKKPVRGQITASLQEEAELLKKLISQTAGKIREALTDKEKEMLKEVDDIVNKQMRKRSSAAYSDLPESTTDDDDDDDFALNEESDESKAKSESKDGSKGKPTRPPSFIIDLTPSRKLLQMAREEGLGKLQFGRKTTVASKSEQAAPVAKTTSATTCGGAAEIINSINLPNRYKRTFNPSAVAVSKAGHVAISDFGSECVLIFDPEGNFEKKIGDGDSNEAGLEGPDGLAFLSNNNLVVSDGPLDGVQALKLYKPTGEYLKTLVELDTNDPEAGEELYFGRITTDAEGRIILTCSGEEPRIQVFDSDGILQLEFGEGNIFGPQKAIFFDEMFFVSDSNVEGQKCNIKMFDKKGKFMTMFDENKLNVGEQDNMGLDVTYPIQISATNKGTILAYHGLSKVIRLYKTDGTFVIEFRTITGIRDLSVYENGNIIVTCGEESMLPRSVQILKCL